MTKTYTVAQAIVKMKVACSPSTVTRHCVALGLEKHGRDWLLTDADLKKLKKQINPKPGNPTFKKEKRKGKT